MGHNNMPVTKCPKCGRRMSPGSRCVVGVKWELGRKPGQAISAIKKWPSSATFCRSCAEKVARDFGLERPPRLED